MREIFNKYFSLIYFSTLFVLIVFKEPAIFFQPRFWAEEGMVFYSFAYNHDLAETLLTPLVGYYTFYNVVVSSFQSTFISVENAPVISTIAGLIVQLIPFILIFYSSSIYFNTTSKKYLLSLSILLITPNEIWINTTNSHFFFGLITFLILIADNSAQTILRYFKYLLLVVGSLTGPMSCFFAPLFIFKYWKDRTKENLYQMLVSVFAGTLQVGITVYCLLYNNQYKRLVDRNFYTSFKAYIADNFALLLPFGENDRFIIGLFIMPISILIFWHIIKNRQSYNYLGLASFLIISILSLLGSLNMAGGSRYGFVPTVILICLLANTIYDNNRRNASKYSVFAGFFLACFILIQLVGFKLNSDKLYQPSFPDWKSEVKKWRDVPTYKMKVHPYDENKGWNVTLLPRKS
ncbi:MAG TPA: hypothetical protein VF691_14555 [Cytophagaceae bacterium]|jgi:hypothetical protein